VAEYRAIFLTLLKEGEASIAGWSGYSAILPVSIRERLRVLTEAKSFEPFRNFVRHGASLR
jgi:hypothetical protein